ncbi:OLC1v1026609C1 [Oldenlandia corymbosa var. corymbosa]|uniref:OLC1v1026609C1 n=1 Tax=Oldenlandia corymbosa var. corymbosa TaxID=529605 RepID=A0AAV1C7W1_OLDCO|nr:OLC1v1026609C1 [Oldenlandia corymbosa var. corymbosa]
MESKQTTPSVIAKLMGFDELRPQHVAPRPVKVFSEDYLRKIASIAMLEKSSVHLNHSLSGTGGKHHSSVHLNHLPSGSEGKQHDNKQVFDVKPNQSTVLARLGFARQKIANGSDAYPIDLQNFHADQPKDVPKHLLEARTSSKMSSKRVVLKSAQKFGDHSGESGADLGDLSRTPSELKDKASNLSKIVVLNPNSRNVHPYGRSLFIGSDALHQGSNGDYMEHESCLKPARKIILNENKSRDLVGDIRLVDKKAALEESMEARINLRGSSRTRSIVKVPSVHLSEASITPCQGFFNLRKRQKISNQVLNGSSYSRVANSNIFERWKAAKYSGELAVPGRRITSGQMFAVHDGAKLETISSSESFSSPKDNSELCISMFHRSKVISTNEYIRNLPSPVRKENSVVADPDPESSIEASQSKCHGLKETGTGYNFSSNTIHSGGNDILPLKVNQGFQDESDSYMVKEANGHGLTDSGDDFFHQKSSYNSFKGELILTCTAGDLGDLGSVKNLRENYQASPDSVLEPALKEEDGQFSESSCSFTDLRGK